MDAQATDLRRQVGIFFSALIIALGGIIYELIIGSTSSYLIGDGVMQFSLTIGFMLFGMGLGSFFAPKLVAKPESTFVLVEALLGVVGGSAPIILFWIFNNRLPFYPLFILLILGIGILIGLEIPLMFSLLRKKSDGTVLLSRLLSLDYIGALIASILFPFVLLPQLGLIRSALVIGLANTLIACLMYTLFFEQLKSKKWIGLVVACAALLLGGELVFTGVITQKLEQGIYKDEVVYAEQTAYQKIVLTKFREDVRLFLNANLQFSSLDEYRYHEPLVHVPMAVTRQAKRVLVLGGGDGLGIRELLKHPGIESIVLVDLDPRMTELAKTHPLLTAMNRNALEHPRVHIVNQDAFLFLRETTTTFDVIIADLPDPNHEALAKLYSVEFYGLAKRHLAQDGAFVTQATSPYASNETFWMIERSLETSGFETTPFHVHVPSFGEWGFILATHSKVRPEASALETTNQFLTTEILPTLFVFDPDLQPRTSSTELNTLDRPLIMNTYAREAARWTGP